MAVSNLQDITISQNPFYFKYWNQHVSEIDKSSQNWKLFLSSPLHLHPLCCLHACWNELSPGSDQSPSGHTSGSRSQSAVLPAPYDQQEGRYVPLVPVCQAKNIPNGPKRNKKGEKGGYMNNLTLLNLTSCYSLRTNIPFWDWSVHGTTLLQM